jgi:hypothetical protein
MPVGRLVVGWDGTDDAGRPVGSGVYHQYAASAGATQSATLVLVK